MTKDDLIERVTGLEGPDRVLDVLISAFTSGPVVADISQEDAAFLAQANEYVDEDTGLISATSTADEWGIPAYTASIDAALTLAEDKQAVLREAIRWLGDRFRLHVNFWPADQNYAQWLALAIVIAALRAQQEGEGA